jgi:hypothetical protein
MGLHERKSSITMRLLAILSILPLLAFGGTEGHYPNTELANLNMASISNYNTLIRVANQIADVTTGPWEPDYAVDDNVASADASDTDFWTIVEMQSLVEAKYDEFVDIDIDVASDVDGNTNDLDDIYLTYTNIADFFADAGMSTNGWRRCATNWPQDWTDLIDPNWDEHGQFDVDDFWGPWIFDDLQRAFDTMRMVRKSASWVETDTNQLNWAGGGSWYHDPAYTRASGVAAAKTAFDSSKINDDSDSYGPKSVFYEINNDDDAWYIWLIGRRYMLRVNVSTNALSEMEYVAFTRAETWSSDDNVFYDQGLGLTEDAWNLFSTVTNDALDPQVYSDRLGTMSYPVDGGACPIDEGKTYGFECYGRSVFVTYEWAYTREP